MLELVQTSQFKRDYKRLVKQGRDMSLLKSVVEALQKQAPLGAKYLDHPLVSNWKGFRECHVASDWILVYRVSSKELTLTLSRTGSHSEVFGL
ncbi:MAG: type II toxin-antitoxin system YafQ family toxin [Oscillibacter sp.]|nr:type II toxin-antitoxin system YafQ family toxin [Oscillibacter sp.]